MMLRVEYNPVRWMLLGQRFDGEEPMSPTVFGAWQRNRASNGAISVVRIYDRPLSEDELNRNITGDLAVDRGNKLTTTWAEVKTQLAQDFN